MVHVVPVVALQFLIGEVRPGHIIMLGVRHLEAIGAVVGPRLLDVPANTHNTSTSIIMIHSIQHRNYYRWHIPTWAAETLKVFIHQKLHLFERSHLGQYLVTVMVLSWTVILWKMRPMLSMISS